QQRERRLGTRGGERRDQEAVARGQGERPAGDQRATEAHRQRGGPQRGRQIGGGQDGEHQAGLERAQAAALLEVQRQDQEERGLARPEPELDEQAGGEGAGAEQARVQQRRPAAAREAPLVGREQRDQDGRGAQAEPGPRRPALLLTLDERQEDRDEAERDQRGPDQVEPARPLGAGL